MTDYTYTPRDWLLLFGVATLLLTWWVAGRIVRERSETGDYGPHQLS